jgi:hypothetical protein
MSTGLKINCCQKVVLLKDFIEAFSIYWPQQRWLYFTCPNCEEGFHVSVSGEVLSFGKIDGSPAPCFIQKFSHRVPGINIDMKSKKVDIQCMEYKARVDAR